MADVTMIDGVWVDTSQGSGTANMVNGVWSLVEGGGGGGTPLPEETGLINGIDQTLANLGYGDLGQSIPTRLLAFYQANGATSDDLATAEWQFLRARGNSLDKIPDMWVEWFRTLGYAESLHEGLKDFWVRNGGAF